ncbi:MAG TPA: hypothetical protein VH372_04605, partial [Actinospica sp.]|nr:hypothetical protein [Actinospica sp.]
MPESFDGMLAELADAAAFATALPDVAAVRRRAHERTVHRRLVASALVLAVLGACGGTVAAVQANRPAAASAGPLDTPPGTTGAATPSPTATASPAQDPSAARSAALEAIKAPFARIAGEWQLVDGGSELVVFPDGVIGMGKTGDWALCDGRLAAAGDGLDFKITALACGDDGTTGLSLEVGPAVSQLTLKVQSGPDVALMYRRVSSEPTAGTATAMNIKSFAGLWRSGTGDDRGFTVLPTGFVSFSGLDDTKTEVTFAGKITGYYGNAARVEIPCPKPVDGLAYCQVLELNYDGTGAGAVSAVGGDGAETFARVESGAVLKGFGLATPTATPTSATATTMQPTAASG